MGIVVGRDDRGLYVALSCDYGGCSSGVLRRSDDDDAVVGALVRSLFERSRGRGWRMKGASYCGDHAPEVERLEIARRSPTVGDGFEWVYVDHGGSQGREAP